MTMCVIWKGTIGNIYAATDSRLSFDEKKLDNCVKISRITCLLHEPGDVENTSKTLVDKREIATLFCGGFTNAYIIKESLTEILNKVVLMKEYSSVSFSEIIDVAFSIYEKSSRKMFASLMEERFGCIFYMISYCPVDKEMQAFKFEFKVNSSGVIYSKSKLFDEINYEISGSGLRHLEQNGSIEQLVEEAYQKNTYTPLLDLLESVINDSNCDSVGGAMQYISCKKEGHTLCCHMLFEDNHHKYMKAGVDLNELNEEFIPLGLFFETDVITKR
ncbi:TPA: hypothetical protein OT866_003482 [Klebsiella aerogenes]|nr:hypothetical protein [Klebsiella aerogenes]